MGIAAHALDELHGRPLRTRIPDACAVGLGGRWAWPVRWRWASTAPPQVSPWIWAFIVVGVFLVVAYNLELFGGAVHSDVWFALAWGAFPVLTAYFAQTGELSVAAVLAAAGVRDGLGVAASAVDTGARPPPPCQRRATDTISRHDGTASPIDAGTLRAAPEAALRLLCVAMPLLAAGLIVMRLVERSP